MTVGGFDQARVAGMAAAIAAVALGVGRLAVLRAGSVVDAASLALLRMIGLSGPPVLMLRIALVLAVQVLFCAVVAILIVKKRQGDRRTAMWIGVAVALALNLLALFRVHVG